MAKRLKKRRDFLPIARPVLGKDEIGAVIQTIKKGWITTGPKSFEFENRFKKYIGAKHAIALNSCTSALHLALAALEVGKGDEVILSPMTFVSQANVIVHRGAKPVFADIRRETLNIDPDQIIDKITDSTKAIILTHFAGQPCEMDAIKKIARDNNLPIIEDAAHALGAEWKGKKLGSDPETITCFSFYPIKNITTAEGGMLTTGSSEIANKVRILSLHGLSKGAWERYSGLGSWEYDVVAAGWKYNMPDILAAMGIVQLRKISSFNSKRRTLASAYLKGLKKIPEVNAPMLIDKIKHAWQIFPVILNTDKTKITRNRLIEELKSLNIGTSVHFKPVHLFKYYRDKFGYTEGSFKISEEISNKILSLPMFPGMTPGDVNYILKALLWILSLKKYSL